MSEFRAAVLEAALEITRYKKKLSALTPEESAQHLKRGPAIVANLDYDVACLLAQRYGWGIFSASTDSVKFYRESLSNLILAIKPGWLRAFEQGRGNLRQALGSNELQCLNAAALLDEALDAEGADWWNTLAAFARGIGEEDRRRAGMAGERWTLEFESARLKRRGITKTPVWVALEDNCAGYDVLSYDLRNGEEDERLIEVKTSSFFPFVFYLSRNEWNVACKNMDRYVIHLWMSAGRVLREMTARELQSHIPLDQGDGKWDTAKVRLPASLFLQEATE